MALTVTSDYDTPFGTTVPTTYWRWTNIGISPVDTATTLTLYGYVDETAYDDKKSPIGQKTYSLTPAEFAALAVQVDGPTPTALSDVIYSYVQSVDTFFENATKS